MMRYQLGPQKALSASAADTLTWEQGTIPSGSQVRGVSFVLTGTAHDIDSLVSFKLKAGGTDIISFLELQWTAWADTPGKKVTSSAAVRFTVPFSTFGYPLANPRCAAPRDQALSMEIITDGTGSGAGTITPVFHLDPDAPADCSPLMVTQSLASGTPSNATFAVTSLGMLKGFILDTTNVTALKFSYAGQDIWNFSALNQILEVQELWSGTTVTTNKLLQLSQPIPVIPGQTNLIVTGSGAVGQVVPVIEVPYPKAS